MARSEDSAPPYVEEPDATINTVIQPNREANNGQLTITNDLFGSKTSRLEGVNHSFILHSLVNEGLDWPTSFQSIKATEVTGRFQATFSGGGKDPQKDFQTYLSKLEALARFHDGLLEVLCTPGSKEGEQEYPIPAYTNDKILRAMQINPENITDSHKEQYKTAWLYYDKLLAAVIQLTTTDNANTLVRTVKENGSGWYILNHLTTTFSSQSAGTIGQLL